MQRIIVIHDEMGIYIGSCIGLGFWTLLDSVGQHSVVTFSTVEEARNMIANWEEHNNPDEYKYGKVVCKNIYASRRELILSGYGNIVGGLEEFNQQHDT